MEVEHSLKKSGKMLVLIVSMALLSAAMISASPQFRVHGITILAAASAALILIHANSDVRWTSRTVRFRFGLRRAYVNIVADCIKHIRVRSINFLGWKAFRADIWHETPTGVRYHKLPLFTFRLVDVEAFIDFLETLDRAPSVAPGRSSGPVSALRAFPLAFATLLLGSIGAMLVGEGLISRPTWFSVVKVLAGAASFGLGVFILRTWGRRTT